MDQGLQGVVNGHESRLFGAINRHPDRRVNVESTYSICGVFGYV